jgi:hypothetical protein
MENQYGYIINQESFTKRDGDVLWDFVRYNENQSTTAYTGIESTVIIESDNVVMFDTPTAFNAWRCEFYNEEI